LDIERLRFENPSGARRVIVERRVNVFESRELRRAMGLSMATGSL
jgi:hypothetical protein